jgi:hypothetical protein
MSSHRRCRVTDELIKSLPSSRLHTCRRRRHQVCYYVTCDISLIAMGVPYSGSLRTIVESGPRLIQIRCMWTCFRSVESCDLVGWGCSPQSALNKISSTTTVHRVPFCSERVVHAACSGAGPTVFNVRQPRNTAILKVKHCLVVRLKMDEIVAGVKSTQLRKTTLHNTPYGSGSRGGGL